MITLITFLRETSFVSQTLLDDFKSSSGYKLITELAIRLEKENTDETRVAMKNLLICLEDFVTAGFIELKPSNPNLNTNMFKIDGFQLPQSQGRGRTVRNTHGFQSLLNIFNKVCFSD